MSKVKESPRFKSVAKIEKDIKTNYAKFLGSVIESIMKKALKDAIPIRTNPRTP
jgi:hypothetical protein